jgi:hypothetical protein
MHEQDIEATDLAANLASTCGPAALFSDHKPGETITYHASSSETRSGVILYVAAPQQIVSTHLPLTYVVDAGMGFPDMVYATDVIESPLA